MAFRNLTCWISTRDGSKVGFHYDPGSYMKANGVEAEYFQFSSEWVQLRRDAGNAAAHHFGSVLKLALTRPA